MPLINELHIEKERNKPLEWKAFPSVQLQPYIHCYRGIIMPQGASTALIQHVTPRGRVALYLTFGREVFYERLFTDNGQPKFIQRPKCSIIGPSTKLLTTELQHTTDLFVVQFKPGMFSAFAGMPVRELYEKWLSPEELWSRALSEQLAELEVKSFRERLHSIEEILLTRLKSLNSVDQSLAQALQLIGNTHGQGSVKSIADHVGLTRRQLTRKFQHHVGISPKQTARITRFDHATQLIKKHAEMSLTEIAYRAGYYDQAHFIREIRQITGRTPSRFFQAWSVETTTSNVSFLQLSVPEQ